jgi:hypothetical protein
MASAIIDGVGPVEVARDLTAVWTHIGECAQRLSRHQRRP